LVEAARSATGYPPFNHGDDFFCLHPGFSPLRRQAARPPKKAPARVNAQMVMVTVYSLVVIMP
jgi:hypothetical protein